MDPLRILVRAAFAFVFLLAMIRISGKRTVKQGTTFDFILALIFGDMVDDIIWAEVAASTFVVASWSLFTVSLISSAIASRARVGAR